MMKSFLFVLAALVIVPSLAFAGGGTKASGVITVKNDGFEQAGFVVLNPGAPIPADQAAFLAAGGKLVDVGGTATFTKQKSGPRILVAFSVSFQANGDAKQYNLGQGKTLNVVVTFDATTGVPTFSP